MTNKSDAKEFFLEFKTRAVRQIGQDIRAVRTDAGGKYFWMKQK